MSTLLKIPSDSQVLEADIEIPGGAEGLIVFAHGSGSDRNSPRNSFVAESLNAAGFATLLADLLSQEEKQADLGHPAVRFDIGKLAFRLVQITDWLKDREDYGRFRIGYFGSSTGAAAALFAAQERPNLIHAVVSRGGRPDMAEPALPAVKAPTLLIVGGNDHPVIEMNRDAFERLNAQKELEIVPAAGHLFEEPGAMEEVARLSREWYREHLARADA